jgi:redox-sensitive bicupin YhaK (pirin superfamily)
VHFSGVRQVEHVERTLNGQAVNTKTVQWIAPGFCVVHEDRFDSNNVQTISLEVIKVAQEPM